MRSAILVLVFAAVTGCTKGEGGPASDALAGDVVAEADAAQAEAVETVEPTCRLVRQWETYPVGDINCRAFAYDDAGLMVLQTFDPDCDGDFGEGANGQRGYCERTTYDAQGRMLSQSSDTDCDGGSQNLCHTWTYDDALHAVEEVEDDDCVDPPNFVWTRTYDDLGRLVREQEQDGPESGFELQCTEKTYDGFGNVLETRYDLGCDGSGELCERDTFDASGAWTGGDADDGCDGVPDRNCRAVRTAVLDSGETQMTQTLDNTCDGIDELCHVERTNARGDQTLIQIDEGCDGVLERCLVHEYDANGSLLAYSVDDPCDGTPLVCGESYTVNADGVKVAWSDDPECTGQALNCHTLILDDDGRPVEDHVSDCHGTVSGCTAIEYDAYGNLVARLSGNSEPTCGAEATYEQHAEYACGE